MAVLSAFKKNFAACWEFVRPKRRIQRPGLFAIAATLLILIFFWLLPPVWQLKQRTLEVEQLRAGHVSKVLVGPGTERWVSLRNTSKYFTYALISAEDGRFYQHMGIDPVEVVQSIKTNIAAGRYKRGASTLTQQLVRMCFLSRHKNLLRKFRETLGALLLELIFDKDEILAWYVNLVEFGPGVYGVKAASKHYFNTLPVYLTIVEGIHLALVLPSPSIWSRSIQQKKLTPFGQSRFVRILQMMRQSGYVNDQQVAYAMKFGDFGRPVYGHPEIVEPDEEESEIEPEPEPEISELDETKKPEIAEPAVAPEPEVQETEIHEPQVHEQEIQEPEILEPPPENQPDALPDQKPAEESTDHDATDSL